MSWLPQPELHPLFETLGYAGGYSFYRRQRARLGDILNDDRRWLIIAASAVGALLDAHLRYVLPGVRRASLSPPTSYNRQHCR